MSSGGLTSSAELSSSLRGGRGGAGTPSNCYHHHHLGSSLLPPPPPRIKSQATTTLHLVCMNPFNCGQPSSPAPSSNGPFRSSPSITHPKLYCNTKGQVIVVCMFCVLLRTKLKSPARKPHIFDTCHLLLIYMSLHI